MRALGTSIDPSYRLRHTRGSARRRCWARSSSIWVRRAVKLSAAPISQPTQSPSTPATSAHRSAVSPSAARYSA